MSERHESGFIPPLGMKPKEGTSSNEESGAAKEKKKPLDCNYNYYVILGYGPKNVHAEKVEAIRSRGKAIATAKRWARRDGLAVFVRECKFNRRSENVRLALGDLARHAAFIANMPRNYGSVTTSLINNENDIRRDNLAKARKVAAENRRKRKAEQAKREIKDVHIVRWDPDADDGYDHR